MRPPCSRTFTLGDLMILVAAVAGGLTLQRWVATPIDPAYRRQFTSTMYVNLPAMNWFDYLCLRTPSCYALMLTIALVLARWIPPRPSARRILRQPGAVAALAVCGAILYGFVLHYLTKSLRIRGPRDSVLLEGHLAAWNDAVRWASAAVLGAWAALAWSGRWASEPSWVDRVGRALGFYWLVYAPLNRIFWPILNRILPIPFDSNWEP